VFFVLSKVLDLLLSPWTWTFVLIALAVPWSRRSLRRWKRRRAFGIAAIALPVFFSFEAVSNAMMWSMEHDAPTTYRPDVTYDVVVLLGGVGDERVTAESGQPAYNDNVERLTMTERLLREGKAKFVIVSGAAMEPSLTEFGEARVLAEQLRAWGVDGDRIVLEERARNTRENAVYSAEIIRARGWKSILVVTSAFHMKRSLECFEAVDLQVDTYQVDYRATRRARTWLPRAKFFADSTAVIHEWFGRVIYRTQGYARARS